MTRGSTPSGGAPSARERVHREMVADIKRIARSHLAAEGSAGLSLRAVARELGMVSSAVYRYVPSRDELLTMLIEDAYNDVGEQVEAADAACDRHDLMGRWLAIGHAFRDWALEHPADYGLIFGSPVPGYQAPAERTVGPANRITGCMTRVLADGVAGGLLESDGSYIPARVRRDLTDLRRTMGASIPDDVLARGMVAWLHLMGSVSMEVFGHLHNVVSARDAFFDAQLRRVATIVGFSSRRIDRSG